MRLRSVSASFSLWLLCWTLLGHFTVFVKCCRQICFHNYFCPNFIYSTLFSSFSLISMTILSVQYMIYNASLSVRETLWNFIGHSVLLGESFYRTEFISVWLWVYIVYIVLEATSDISVRLEMRQIGPITYLSCWSVGPMNLADTVHFHTVVSKDPYFLVYFWMCLLETIRLWRHHNDVIYQQLKADIISKEKLGLYCSPLIFCPNLNDTRGLRVFHVL